MATEINKLTSITEIITHSGPFHSDESFAYGILHTILPNAKLTRTRDVSILEKKTKSHKAVLIDVGGLHEPDNLNFDHHHLDETLVTSIYDSDSYDYEIAGVKQTFTKHHSKSFRKHTQKAVVKIVKKYINIDEKKEQLFYFTFKKDDKELEDCKTIEGYVKNYINDDIEKYLSFFSKHSNCIYLKDTECKYEIINSFQSYVKYRKYSSLGLVWKYFGRDYLRKLEVPEDSIELIHTQIDEGLIKRVDNNDNGIHKEEVFTNIVQNFNEQSHITDQDSAFKACSHFFANYLRLEVMKRLHVISDEKHLEREYVLGNTIQYFSKYYKGIQPFYGSQEGDNTYFTIFLDEEGKYRVISTPKKGFERKMNLPGSWLETPPKGCEFVHQGLFIAVFDTLENIKLAVETIKIDV